MKKILLSLKPVQESRWETHEPSGTRFLIAALPADEDQASSAKASDIYGNLNSMAFAHEVAPKIIKGWEGIGDPKTGIELPLNEENLREFVKWHGLKLMPWIISRARSFEHFRGQEIEAAKNA